MKKRKKTGGKAALLFIEIALMLMTLSFLYPLYFIGINSLKTRAEYTADRYSLPASATLDNFKAVIVDYNLLHSMAVTLFVSVVSTLLIVVTAAIASYAIAKLHFKFRTLAYTLILATMFLPAQITMIPRYIQFSKMHLIDSPWAVIISYWVTGLPSAVLLLRNAFNGISDEVIESARIDGAGFFTIIGKIVLPMSAAAISIVVIFQFLAGWNDFLTPLLYLTDRDTQTVMVILSQMVKRYNNQPTNQFAGLFISLVPTVIVYLCLQKYMVKGAMSGSIK